MNTTATNRKIRVLITAIRNYTLLPRPEFQRRLVWADKHKSAFIETVLEGFPFPEIYIAAGDVNPDTGEGAEMLVDGQQRVTTLSQYFNGSDDLKLSRGVPMYASLSPEEKRRFLEYDVVVRDLGPLPLEEIKTVFLRINSTNYALNAMEIDNARFEGEFKTFGDEIAEHDFFEEHHVFSISERRRMLDTRFALTLAITVMATYFNRDSDLELYLSRYNDEFPIAEDLRRELHEVFRFIDRCEFGDKSRAWKKADLLTLSVEIHRALFKHQLKISHDAAGTLLRDFYHRVDNFNASGDTDEDAATYNKYSIQATNDRGSRIARANVIAKLLLEASSMAE
jgi:hypothetical protein